MMSIGLNTATLAEKDPRKQIAIAKDSGFSAIGLWINDLGWDADDEYLQEIAFLSAQAGLGINELDFLKAATSAERSFGQVFSECTRMAHVAHVLGCPVIVAAPAGAGEEDLSFEQYRQLMACGKKEDVVVSLEFPVTAKTYSTLESVLPLVDSTDIPLTVDAFHFLAGGSRLTNLEKLDVHHIALVHLSDAEDHPVQTLRTVKHDLRTYPGEGILPVAEFMQVIKNLGYRGSYSVEVWNKRINAEESPVVARKANRTIRRILGVR